MPKDKKTDYEGVWVDAKGQFYYQLRLGTDQVTGKSIRVKSRTDADGKKFETALEASEERTRVRLEFKKSKKSFSNYDMTFEQFLDSNFLPYYRGIEKDPKKKPGVYSGGKVKPQTYESRKPAFKAFIERFGRKKLRNISATEIDDYRTYLMATYSSGYASTTFSLLKQVFTRAFKRKIIQENVFDGVEPIPKGYSQVLFWTKEQFEAVIKQINISDFYEHMCFVMIWTYFMTGLRVNELTAMYWSDVDLEKKKMKVEHTLILHSREDWKRQNRTKTHAGMREVSLDDDTVQILKNWKERQAKLGKVKFVISYDGLPMIRSTIGRIVKRYAALADAPLIQPKGLRHSHVSYLINEYNCNLLVLSKRIGHSSPEITLKHYGHLYKGADEELANSMSGQIKIETASESHVNFNGNQAIKKPGGPETDSKNIA